MQGVTGSSPVVSTKKEEVALAVASSFLVKLRLEQLTHLCVNLVRIPPHGGILRNSSCSPDE